MARAPRRESRLSAFGAEQPAAPVARQPARQASEPRAVSEVVAEVNALLGGQPTLADVWVRGEVSGLTQHASGHWYFTLKDAKAVLSAAMFRAANQRVRFPLGEGMEVLARGRVGVYAGSSRLQLVVEEMQPVGAGELALRFEDLKRRLAAEGLFDPARKRPLPQHPRRVGLVTSRSGAALRDLVRVATSRNPAVRLLLAHARVQGEGAAEEVAAALRRLDARGACDVIIVGRGGGSVEDLWAFNEEAVVRAIAACRAPVVSAVGHETDFTLCDLAADARAATPSNAAEMVVPDAEAIHDAVDALETRMLDALDRLVPELAQRVDELAERAADAVRSRAEREREVLAAQSARLQALSPLATLARGYAVVRNGARVVRSVRDAREGDQVEVMLKDGALGATVTRKEVAQDEQGEG